jgi:hypothetical protein
MINIKSISKNYTTKFVLSVFYNRTIITVVLLIIIFDTLIK